MSILRLVDIALQIKEASEELLAAESQKSSQPPPIDIAYFHDVGLSLCSEYLQAGQLKAFIARLTAEKLAIASDIKKQLGFSLTADLVDQNETSSIAIPAKVSLRSLSDIIDGVTNELSSLVDSGNTSGLRLFVHDRLGPGEPPLHFSSWEQRFQQRIASAKDKIGRARQNIIDIVNSTSSNFSQHPMITDQKRWTSFVSLIDEALYATIKRSLESAFSLYQKQLQGGNVRELFSVNLKLSSTCNLVMIPTHQDLSTKLTTLFRQVLLSICPDNAVAHVVSHPTSLTKDGNISIRKRCAGDASVVKMIENIESITMHICGQLSVASSSVQKDWSYSWSPSSSSSSTSLLQTMTAIQANFNVSHTIGGGAVLLNAFPLQDAIISMIHVQIENAKDDEIKKLVDVWKLAMGNSTTKSVCPLSGTSLTTRSFSETTSLDSISENAPPKCQSTGLYPTPQTSSVFCPLSFAQNVVDSVKQQSPQTALSHQPSQANHPFAKLAPTSGSEAPVEIATHPNAPNDPAGGRAPSTEMPPPQATRGRTSSGLPHSDSPATYTTMTVEEVNENTGVVSAAGRTAPIPTTFRSTTPPQAAPSPSTPRDVSDSAAEFRRMVEQANIATAAAAQRKEELRLNSPRSPNRKSSLRELQDEANSPLKPLGARDVPTKAQGVCTGASEAGDVHKSLGEIRPIMKPKSSTEGKSQSARRTVDFDPKTTTGGNGPSAAFKKASAPADDDDETILRKLLQKEKESMERIRLMKEKDELRRKEIAAAHRRTIAEEETYVNREALPAVSTPNSPIKRAIPSSGNFGTPTTPSTSPDRSNQRPALAAIRNPPSQQTTPRETSSNNTSTPIAGSGPLFVRQDALRPEAMSSTSAQGRPDSALRRKLALPPVQNTQVTHNPCPPSSGQVSIQSLRKPQTAPVGCTGGSTPRGTSLATPAVDARTTSLLDIYKNCCAQFGIKPNSGLLKILPKTVGENITKINLDLNYIGVRGFQPLLQILKVNRGLTFLNLKDNNLENNEIRSLVSVLCTDCGDLLQHLDLSNNPISLAGGSAILDLIAKQKSLTTVIVNGTLIQPKIIDKIVETLASKKA